MASVDSDLQNVLVGERELWRDGAPNEQVLDRLDGRQTCDLVTGVAQPVVSRVIGSFMGIAPEDDQAWARLINATLAVSDPDLNPDGVERGVVRNRAEHQAFGAGGRHFCLGTALARLELRILFEETLARYPTMEMAGAPTMVESLFVNQLKTLPVRLGPISR